MLVLGQQLGVGNPWDEVMKALRFDGEAETFLQALTARAEASQQRALLIIDAINENNGLQLWPDHLAAFLTVARRFPWVGVILSVRTVAKDMILPEATENLTQGWNWVRHFSARVTTNEGVSPAVTWSVEGAASAGTTISADGLLSVAANETASSLTVVATSVVDPTKTSSARVTLTPPGTTSVVVKAQAAPASIAGGGTFTL
ncbi:hypothetical protein ABZS66_20995, partial [Dactylosporangium sp. NPDC005572]|uniref:hypothetical protein n=1 Tax=Dactylosporangium sp. NPDC005572 TaxID=3156889 RepID=UPI0033A8466B